jgi:hypothetical protein
MPWDYRKTSDGKYEVYNKDTGASKGKSATREKALAHLRALYAHASPDEMKHQAVKKLMGH